MKESIILKKNNIELYGLLEGPDMAEEHKVPLVLIMHGVNTSSKQHPFYNLVRALWERGMATLRFDFSGHGRSGGEMKDMTLSHLLEDAEIYFEYARSLKNIREIYLFGYSIGGVIAGQIALRHKNEVRKLVMMSPASDLSDKARSGYFFGKRFDPDNVPDDIDTGEFTVSREYIIEAQKFDVYDSMKDYDGNVLLIYGESDERVPVSNTLKYKDVIQNLRIVSVPEAGHLWQDHYAEAIETAAGFLADS